MGLLEALASSGESPPELVIYTEYHVGEEPGVEVLQACYRCFGKIAGPHVFRPAESTEVGES